MFCFVRHCLILGNREGFQVKKNNLSNLKMIILEVNYVNSQMLVALAQKAIILNKEINI